MERHLELNKALYRAISQTEESCNKSELPERLLWADGHSSPKQRMFLNRLCGAVPDVKYLEAGVFCGATLLSAAYDNAGMFLGIDDFSGGTREEFKSLGKLLGSAATASVITKPVDQVTAADLPKANVFFYDINPDDTASAKALERWYPAFADDFILIVDNWSRPGVISATADVFSRLDLVTYSAYQLVSDADCDINGWWSGWLVSVVRKKAFRTTHELRGFGKDETPIYQIQKRASQGLLSLKDYDKQHGI